MRRFVVSDLHGNGNIYDAIVGYLENVSKSTEEDVVLYINGDLIDRGEDSARILVDVKNRIENHIGFPIVYLAGNHELSMYQASLQMETRGVFPYHSDWIWWHGGGATAYGLEDMVTIEEQDEIISFVSNLKIYQKLEEMVNGKKIVLVHAKCPKVVEDDCSLRIKDNNKDVECYLWTRKHDPWIPFRQVVGNKKYFSIIGHTPVDHPYGFEYDSEDDFINIDGGCAAWAKGYTKYNHSPLVEIDGKNNRLIILTFNNTNEIIYGNYFQDGKTIPMDDRVLEENRSFLDHSVVTKKLVLYDE